jgi:thiamine pyrophosphate-dependent acetolactate synthase large subunit-like protein
MGGSVPTAIGAAVADSATPVICVCGDGGIRMYLAEVAVAVAHRLPVCFILMSDGRYGSVAVADRTSTMSRAAVDVPQSTWLAAFEGMGCEVTQASDLHQFAERIGAWKRSAPLYLECRFPAAEYAAMTHEIR